jgi:hypothetical protein
MNAQRPTEVSKAGEETQIFISWISKWAGNVFIYIGSVAKPTLKNLSFFTLPEKKFEKEGRAAPHN